MMQGDTYSIAIKITSQDIGINEETFTEIEAFIGSIRKTKSKGDIIYDEKSGLFLVSLTQSETFRLKGKEKVQLRCKTENDEVIGVDCGDIDIKEAISKVVL